MDETSKALKYWGQREKTILRGRGIDIGCGPDPVMPDCRRFDLEDGDANEVSRYVQEQFDYVYSSHCLEHMHQPSRTILDWWKLVKPGGHLFILVPDEDLYEQGVFPSRFNNDHKATFTISKSVSWSRKSINVLDLANSLPGGQLVSLELQDRGYDRTLMTFGKREVTLWVRLLARLYRTLVQVFGEARLKAFRTCLIPYFPVDQTSGIYNAQAQIQLIVRKSGGTI